MRETGTRILGVGTHLPSTVRGNEFWPSSFKAGQAELGRRNILAIERSTHGEKVEVPPEIAAAMAVHSDDPWRGAKQRRVIDEGTMP
jgi:hypothetical protein